MPCEPLEWVHCQHQDNDQQHSCTQATSTYDLYVYPTSMYGMTVPACWQEWACRSEHYVVSHTYLQYKALQRYTCDLWGLVLLHHTVMGVTAGQDTRVSQL